MSRRLKLRLPIEVSGIDVENALTEEAKANPAIAHALEELRGPVAGRASAELNRVLDLNMFKLLAKGWAGVRPVRNALELSALMPGPPVLVQLQPHNVTSTLYPVLGIALSGNALPEVRLTLKLVVGVRSATVAARAGRVELVALGKTSVLARLSLGAVLLKEHATIVEGHVDSHGSPAAGRDPPPLDIQI